MNGLILGPILVTVGAAISYFSGMLIVAVSAKTGTDRYEDMARLLFGKKVERVVCILNLVCLIGFIMSYIVFVKDEVPALIMKFYPNLPHWINNSFTGETIWCTIFSVS